MSCRIAIALISPHLNHQDHQESAGRLLLSCGRKLAIAMMIFSSLVGAVALFRLSLDVAHAFISPSTTAGDGCFLRPASPASFMQTTPFLTVHQQEASRRGVARIPQSSRRKASTSLGLARGNRRPSEEDDFEYFDDDEDDEEYYPRSYDRARRRRRRGADPSSYDDLGDFSDRSGLDLPSSYGRRDGWRLPESLSKALLAGVFVLGVGLGVTVDSQVNTNPKDLASRDAIDNAAPNPTLCAKLGASAMAFDQRVFVSFNPFNVYVSQADVKPACVLREANVVPVLKAKGLINDNEVRSCKQNMNTWAFVGSLDETPQLSCVYKSQDAQNEFLSNPKVGIGEDYLDDDRETIKDTKKIVKGSLTEAQKQLLRNQGASVPGLL